MPSCAVFNCRSGYGRSTEKVRLLAFPKKNSTFKKWYEAVDRKDLTLKKASSSYICEKHFTESDWIRPELNTTTRGKAVKKKVLKEDAVPTLFLRGGAPAKESPTKSIQGAKKDHDYSFASTSDEAKSTVEHSETNDVEVSSFVEVQTGNELTEFQSNF